MLAGLDVARAVAGGCSQDHAHGLELTWRPPCRHFGKTSPERIDYDALEGYVGARRADGIKGQTIRREVQAVRRGLAIGKRRGWLSTVPDAPRIKSDPKDARRRGKLHPVDVLRAWLAAMTEEARDQAQIAALTGLRSAELKRLEASWVLPAPMGAETDLVIRIPAESAKSRRERVVGLPELGAEIILRCVARHPEGGPLLAGDYRRARADALKAIGYGSQITLRDLRHTYATLALATTGDPWATMAALGHSDLSTTSLYQSTTPARAAAVGAAVARALTGSPGPDHHHVSLVGADGIEPTAPSSQNACEVALLHVAECGRCLDLIVERLGPQLEEARNRNTNRHTRSRA